MKKKQIRKDDRNQKREGEAYTYGSGDGELLEGSMALSPTLNSIFKRRRKKEQETLTKPKPKKKKRKCFQLLKK